MNALFPLLHSLFSKKEKGLAPQTGVNIDVQVLYINYGVSVH